MAQIGLKYLLCAPIDETGADVTHKDGIVMAYAIKADVNIDLNEAKLSADDRIVESIKEFKEGKLTVNGDHLSYDTLALILGHKVETLPDDGGKILIAKGDDDGAYVGVGFYATSLKNGVKTYRAIWLQKVKFGIPNESLETKGDGGIKFQTPTIEGTILTDIQGTWKTEGTFTTEEMAREWLNEKAGIDPSFTPQSASINFDTGDDE
jgi:phi13 family phage major tail protein